jgi:hypothetical protein
MIICDMIDGSAGCVITPSRGLLDVLSEDGRPVRRPQN